MRTIFIVMLIFASLTGAVLEAAGQSPAVNAEQQFRQGYKKYKAGEFQEGLDHFSLALTNMPVPPAFDAALVQYNLGIGYFRLSQPEKAAESFRKALKTTDIALQEKSYFNLGNSLYQTAQQKLNEGEIALAFKTFQDAQTNYVQAMRLNSEDRDIKINYELTVLSQIKILQMVSLAMSRLQQGDQLVNDYKFVEAAQWFQENLPLAEKALSLEPEMKKQFEQMSERSTKVAEIIVPSVQPMGMPGGAP